MSRRSWLLVQAVAQPAGGVGAPTDLPAVTLERVWAAGRKVVSMTKREREVVELIAKGFSNRGIAERLHIALHTVKSHMHNVLEKLSLHSRLQVAAHVHAMVSQPRLKLE
jgi:ATP/maltotriose-dependent transcriptional regulator MalT